MAEQKETNEDSLDPLPPLESDAPGTVYTPLLEQTDQWEVLGSNEEVEDTVKSLGVWYRTIETRLRSLPDNTESYQTTFSIVMQLQELFVEVLAKKDSLSENVLQGKLTFSFDDLCRTMSLRQATLYKYLVQLQQEELEHFEEKMKEVEEEVMKEEVIDDLFSERQRYLLHLEETKSNLKAYENGLRSLIDSPKPSRQASFVHQQVQQIEHESVGPKSQMYKDNQKVCGRCTILLLQCQELNGILDTKIADLESKQEETRNRFQNNLEEVEDWLMNVCSILCQEPIRKLIKGAHPQDDNGQVFNQDEGSAYDSNESLLNSEGSGSSFGAEPLGEESEALETSINADLEDDDYMSQINDRVFASPIDEGPFLPGDVTDQKESTDLDTVLGVGVTTCQTMTDLVGDVDANTETDGSIASESTVRAKPASDRERIKSSDSKSRKDTDGEQAEECSAEGVKPKPSLGEEELSDNKESPPSIGSGESPRGDELGDSKGDESGTNQESEEGSEEWQEEVELLPMVHDTKLEEFLPSTRQHQSAVTIEELLDSIQVTCDLLPAQHDKIKQVVADINLVANTVSKQVENELISRLAVVGKITDQLAESLAIRRAELQFEKAQLSVLWRLTEAKDELEMQPGYLLLPEHLIDRLTALEENIDPDVYDAIKTEVLSELSSCVEGLNDAGVKEAEFKECERSCNTLHQVFNAVTDKMTAQKAFLEEGLSLWDTFQSGCGAFRDWMDKADDLVTVETYGYDIEEVEHHQSAVKRLKEDIPSQEASFSTIVKHVNIMLEKMESGEDPEVFVDQQLIALEQRWQDLVTQSSGIIDTVASNINMVLIKWKKYNGMFEGTRAFIKQMIKMVGTEPLESSDGDDTKLTMYKTYQSQLNGIEAQYNRLLDVGNELASNQMVGSRTRIKSEIIDLQLQWEPLKDNINDSLQMLVSEYNDWIMVKLEQMESLIEQMEELVNQKIMFVETFPLAHLFDEDASELLGDADLLVASQEQIDQIENSCINVEEVLLQRQIQQETSSSLAPSASSIELPATTRKRENLLQRRDHLQTKSDALQPIMNVFYLQLQLLQNIQEGREMVAKAINLVGEQEELEEFFEEMQDKFSLEFFDNLSSDAFDLGAVAEDCETSVEDMADQNEFRLPAYGEISKANALLGDEINALNTSADEEKMHLQLFIHWWAEYRENYTELSLWLTGAESHLGLLIARGDSTQPPLVGPRDLLLDTKELQSEVEDKQVVLSALVSTCNNIVEEMEARNSPPGEITDQKTNVQERFESLSESLSDRVKDWEIEADKFDSYLSHLTAFTNWMNEFHSTLSDEVCIGIPNKASEDIVARHKAKLEEYCGIVLSRTPEFECLQAESERWGEYLIPEDVVWNLPSPSEPSPPPFMDEEDFPPQSQLPYIKKRATSTSSTWSKIQHILQDRGHQLEMHTGSLQTFLEHQQNLIEWIEGKLNLDLLAAPPPGSTDKLQQYIEELQTLSSELVSKGPLKESVSQSVPTLREGVSAASVELVDQKMIHLEEQWKKLAVDKDKREKVCRTLLTCLEDFWAAHSSLNEWLTGQDSSLQDCGPIGANLHRLSEQMDILEKLDEDFLIKKKDPEELVAKAMSILDACRKGSGQEVSYGSEDCEHRFQTLSHTSVERQELCEEALSAMQEFQKKVDNFTEWLGKMEKSLEEAKENKKPIGTVQLQLEDFYDFMRDVEAHTEDYLALCPEAKVLSDKYKPSDVLDEVMSSLRERWFTYVGELEKRCGLLIGLVALWNRFESEVKGLLDWVSEEANSFSREVTTRGDKGVDDHIESCKKFTDTMVGKKKTTILDIQDLVVTLRVQDGVKRNGTSDVDSRWNDVNQHWDSLCGLLAETMHHLESTYHEVCKVIKIREEQFEWLEGLESVAGEQKQTDGDIAAVASEIETHSQLLTDVHNHKDECNLIEQTVPYLVEHLPGAEREAVKERAQEYCQRYSSLSVSLDTYVQNLEESIPHWQDFKKQTRDLATWIEWGNQELVSERLISGNATVTETSLGNAHNLYQDSQAHQEALTNVSLVANTLEGLAVPGDKCYIADTLDCLNGGCSEVSSRAADQVEVLTERLKSWQVFPVEEAIMVQKILEEVGGVVEEEIQQELSSEQLLDRLKQLEEIQEIQQSNESKVSTIEHSADREDIRKALEKNPDISKERNNLLQGWSSVSDSLKAQIVMMKKRAEMVSEIESLISSCDQGLTEYRKHLEAPLPPSVVLVTVCADMRHAGDTLHNKCQSILTNLQSVFTKYDSEESAVPNHLKNMFTSYSEKFHDLSAKAKERADQIEDTVSSWDRFSAYLNDLSGWCRSSSSELSTLRVVENFAMEFSSLESRLQLLSDEVQENAPGFDLMAQTCSHHCKGESPEVVEVKEQYSKVEASWHSIRNQMKSFPELIQPWKELTDLFDQLYSSLEVLENRVMRDIVSADRLKDEGDLSDVIVRLKDHNLKISQHTPTLQKLHEFDDQLLTPQTCQKYEPSRELKDECAKLEAGFNALRETVEEKLEKLQTQERVWRAKANTSIQRLPLLQHQLAVANEEKNAAEDEKRTLLADIAKHEAIIKELRTRPLALPVQVQHSYPLFTKIHLFFFFLLSLILYLVYRNIELFGSVRPPAVLVL